MRHLYNYGQFQDLMLLENLNDQTVSEYLSRIKNANSLNELEFISSELENEILDEGIFHRIKNFIKDKVTKIKNFFSGGDELADYILYGDEDEEKNEPIPEEEMLLIYTEPSHPDDITYMIYNGMDISKHKQLFPSNVFSTYNIQNKFHANLKDHGAMKVSRYKTNSGNEYVIAILSYLDELEVPRELYGSGAIEKVTPRIVIHLRYLQPGFEDRLYKYYEDLLKLPKNYNIKNLTKLDKLLKVKRQKIEIPNFDIGNLKLAINTIKVDSRLFKVII